MSKPSQETLIKSANTIVEQKGICAGGGVKVDCRDCPAYRPGYQKSLCDWSTWSNTYLKDRMEKAKAYLKEHDTKQASRPKRTFKVGDRVRVSRNTAKVSNWLAGREGLIIEIGAIDGYYYVIFDNNVSGSCLPWQQLHKVGEE